MGWDDQAEIIAKCREIAPGAFVDSMPVSKIRNVVIDDGPTRVRFRKGPNEDYTFTGQEFYDMFIAPIREDLVGTTDTWIECMDIDSLMSRHKFREQKERSDARKRGEEKKKDKGIQVVELPKYDPESYFCEAGIRSKDGTVTQRFNIQAVTTNRVLRNKLTVFCGEMMMFDPLPVGRSVILHHLPTGPGQFIRVHDQQTNAYRRLNSHSHLFGEADHQMGYWTTVYGSTRGEQEVRRPENIEVRSIDSDVLGILCHAVSELNKEETKEKRTQVYWNRGVIKGGKGPLKNHPLVHINHLVMCFNQMKFPVRRFVMINHIFGSDFAVKKNLCTGTTFRTAWPTIAKEHKDLDSICVNADDLAKHGMFTVWEHIINKPTGDALDFAPAFFKSLEPHIGTFPEANDSRYEKSCKVLEQFVWKFPRCKPGEDTKQGCLDVFWATQYHCFPFGLLKVDRPSNFIEVDDEMEID